MRRADGEGEGGLPEEIGEMEVPAGFAAYPREVVPRSRSMRGVLSLGDVFFGGVSLAFALGAFFACLAGLGVDFVLAVFGAVLSTGWVVGAMASIFRRRRGHWAAVGAFVLVTGWMVNLVWMQAQGRALPEEVGRSWAYIGILALILLLPALWSVFRLWSWRRLEGEGGVPK